MSGSQRVSQQKPSELMKLILENVNVLQNSFGLCHGRQWLMKFIQYGYLITLSASPVSD